MWVSHCPAAFVLCSLQELPAELCSCTGLSHLDVSKNRLLLLPEQFSNLSCITQLSLTGEQGTTLWRIVALPTLYRVIVLTHSAELMFLEPKRACLGGGGEGHNDARRHVVLAAQHSMAGLGCCLNLGLCAAVC